VLAGAPALATFVGGRTRLAWPADHDLRRIAVRDPAPVYPHSLIWRGDNAHPALAALRAHLDSTRPIHCVGQRGGPTVACSRVSAACLVADVALMAWGKVKVLWGS
jgi:hypothetical protein